MPETNRYSSARGGYRSGQQKEEEDELTATLTLRDGRATDPLQVDLRTRRQEQVGPAGQGQGWFFNPPPAQIRITTYVTDRPRNIQFFVQKTQGGLMTVSLAPDAFVQDLQRKVSDNTGLSSTEYWLEFAGRQLEKGQKLSHYNIHENVTVRMMMRLRGGQMGSYSYP